MYFRISQLGSKIYDKIKFLSKEWKRDNAFDGFCLVNKERCPEDKQKKQLWMYLDENIHIFSSKYIHIFQVEKHQNSEDYPFNRTYTELNKYIILSFSLSGSTA